MLPRPQTLREWGEMFTDLSVWIPVVRDICAREGLACKTIKAGFPGSNAVFLVDNGHVVKIFGPMFEDDYGRELAAYRFVTDAQLIMPALVASGRYDDGNSWPYLISTFCPGEAMRVVRNQLSERDLSEIAGHLGQMVHRLHLLQLEGLDGWVALTWDSYFRQQIDKVVVALRQRNVFCPDLLSAIHQSLEQTQPRFVTPNLTFVHADLTEDHLLLLEGREGWVISALIDFADAEIAPAEYEWIALWFGLLDQNTQAFHSFMQAYDPGMKLDEAWRDRMLAMTFLHRYGAGIVNHALAKQSSRPETLSELKETLWPSSLLR